ncbi:CYSTM domain-containing protein [Caenorhabditis elegans]|uniref:CYSTM domain-containing protein n=3 Tax=Caenorhabditis TaxID=6237 RepID=W6RY45_CAEEL|nr:CYSTM domain-containing protein [Caenorhabditis elegans]CDM63520.1 CYSTM domain-containing protein [Caenorhabditis elegans]|eukprot:NP_001294165.1 Uncharacterized protein CELE_C33H5.13 [Caenorhabditis elegans]
MCCLAGLMACLCFLCLSK